MTREEATKWLNAIKDKYIRGGDEGFDNKRREAIDTAIKSLKALEKIDALVHKTYWAYPIGIDYCLDSLEDILKEVGEVENKE